MFKVNNRITKTSCERYSKLTIKTPDRHHWHCSGAFIITYIITLFVLVFLFLTLSRYMPIGTRLSFKQLLRKSINGLNSLSYSTPSLWNILPLEYKRSENINSFKHNVKSYYLTKWKIAVNGFLICVDEYIFVLLVFCT